MKQNTNSATKFLLKLWKNDGMMKRWQSPWINRILQKIKAEVFQKAYVKVVYGKGPDVFGKIVTFYNDGFYDTRQELFSALRAFTESNKVYKDVVPTKNLTLE